MKDIVGGWAEACRKHGLKLGVSMHGAHACTTADDLPGR